MTKKIIVMSLTFILFWVALRPAIVGAAEKVQKHTIIAIDFTASDKKKVKNYWEEIALITGCKENAPDSDKQLCSKIMPGDRVTIIKITDTTRTQSEIISDIYLKQMSFMDAKIPFLKKALAAKAEFRSKIKQAFDKPILARKSEIIAGVRAAADYFKDVNASQRTLVVLSDMLEDSEYYNFESKKVNPEEYVKREIGERRMPDLKSVRVYVSGASAATGSKLDEVKAFWMLYFKTAGAEVKDSGYTNRMINYP